LTYFPLLVRRVARNSGTYGPHDLLPDARSTMNACSTMIITFVTSLQSAELKTNRHEMLMHASTLLLLLEERVSVVEVSAALVGDLGSSSSEHELRKPLVADCGMEGWVSIGWTLANGMLNLPLNLS